MAREPRNPDPGLWPATPLHEIPLRKSEPLSERTMAGNKDCFWHMYPDPQHGAHGLGWTKLMHNPFDLGMKQHFLLYLFPISHPQVNLTVSSGEERPSNTRKKRAQAARWVPGQEGICVTTTDPDCTPQASRVQPF